MRKRIFGLFVAMAPHSCIACHVDQAPEAAQAIGLSVLSVRYLAVMFGGAMAGMAGAYLSLVYTPLWADNMTAGRGWIALALVVFASWRVE